MRKKSPEFNTGFNQNKAEQEGKEITEYLKEIYPDQEEFSKEQYEEAHNMVGAHRLSPESAQREGNYLLEYLRETFPEQEGNFSTEQYEAAADTISKSFYYTDAKIYVTRSCNGDCPFCLTDMRPDNKEANTENFLAAFEKNIEDYVRHHGRKVLFTGGEPTDKPERIFGCLEILQKYQEEGKLDLVVLYTNGTYLMNEVDGQEGKQTVLQGLSDRGLEHINMSVHHYNQEERKKISPIIGAMDTEHVMGEIEKTGMQLRLNCTLMKDFVGDIDSVKQYISWAHENGVKDIYFRDLFHLPKRDSSTLNATKKAQKKLQFTDEQRVMFDRLVAEVKQDGDFELKDKLSRHKEWGRTYIFVHKPTGAQISFGRLTIGMEDPNEATYYTMKADGQVTKNMNRAENTVEYDDEGNEISAS